jgi:hypothetical protein
LHTWGQNLHHHPHLHGVCTGGGLSIDTSRERERPEEHVSPKWVSCRPGFFLPVRVLSRVFRGKYLELLRRAFDRGELRFPGKLAPLRDAPAFQRWLTPLYRKDWVVYSKRPFGGPEQVLKYLARYTHRVAISNSRLLKLEHGTVTFGYKDYAQANRQKTMQLSAEEFLRRFVQHVLPRGFVKLRHYGLLANRDRDQRLDLCRKLLLPVNAATTGAEPRAAATGNGIDPAPPPCCPNCGSVRLLLVELPMEVAAAACALDTS